MTDLLVAPATGEIDDEEEIFAGVPAGAVSGEVIADAAPHRLGRNIGALFGGQLVTWSMTLIWTLVVPRALGPVGLGIIVSAQSVSGFLTIILGLGTRAYLVRESVIDPAEGPKLVGTAIVLRLLLTPVVAVAAVVWAHLAHYNSDATIVLYLITAMTTFALLAEPLQAAFQAIERMQYLAYTDVINKTALSLVGIALVTIGFRAVGVASSMAAMAALVILLNVIWLRRWFKVDLRTNRHRIVAVARRSVPYFAYGVFGMVYFWIDTVMLSLLTTSKVVGWYGASSQLFQTLMFLPGLLSTAWLPRLVDVSKQGRLALTEKARAPIELVLVISLPVAAGTALVAPTLIHTLYGGAFSGAVPVMVVLAFCVLPIYLNMILGTILIAGNRQVVWTFVMGGAAVLNPLMNLVLIPMTQSRYHNGAIGAAASLVLTELIMDGVGFALVGRNVLTRGALRRFALVFIACAAMWGVAFAARPLGTIPSLAVGGLTLLVLLVVLRVATPDEVDMLRQRSIDLRARLSPQSR